jgi:hypothetical protein
VQWTDIFDIFMLVGLLEWVYRSTPAEVICGKEWGKKVWICKVSVLGSEDLSSYILLILCWGQVSCGSKESKNPISS